MVLLLIYKIILNTVESTVSINIFEILFIKRRETFDGVFKIIIIIVFNRIFNLSMKRKKSTLKIENAKQKNESWRS